MYSDVALTRGWRGSLGYREVFLQAPSGSSVSSDCPKPGDTVITDVTGYIAVTMGDAVLLPSDCSCSSDSTTSSGLTPAAIIMIEQSADGVDWSLLCRAALLSPHTSYELTEQPTGPYLRVLLIDIQGDDSYVTVTAR